MNHLHIDPCTPFGAIISHELGDADIREIPVAQIMDWIRAYKVVVFRGFRSLEKQELALYGQDLGEPLQWPFGSINELKVKPDAENYIFTDHAVPMHWDGAFAGKVPHVILFQCLVAPDKRDLGGTTFCDTTAILRDATPDQLRQWGQVRVTYETKKVVHYGGRITQPLITKHPVDGTNILRYAEPVDDLNPVKLEVAGLQGGSQQAFLEEIKGLLYDPRYHLVHRWDEGDIVMADNHALLHGREAFLNPQQRHIQRINVLHRPPLTLGRRLKHWLTIRRKEFFVAELPIFLIPLALSIAQLSDMLAPEIWLGLLALIMFFNIGDMANCLADRELDAIYKSHLSNAVYELGKRNVKWQIAVSALIGLAATGVAAWLAELWLLIPVTVLGLLVGIAYSMPPLKFKSRGLLQFLCLWGIIFFGPMGYSATLAQHGPPEWRDWGVFAAFGFMQMGIILLNTAEDFTEDRAAGLRTVIVVLGLHRSMYFAWGTVLIAGLALQLLLAWELAEEVVWHAGFVVVLTLGWLWILSEYFAVLRKIRGLDEADATKQLKKNGMKVPRWLKIGAYATLAVVLARLVAFL